MTEKVSPELERGAKTTFEDWFGSPWEDEPGHVRRDWIDSYRKGISATLEQPSQELEDKISKWVAGYTRDDIQNVIRDHICGGQADG